MRAFWATFTTGFNYLWRNPISVAMIMVFPIVLILILGSALSSYISVDTSLDPASVAVAADQEGTFGAFIQSDDIAQFLDVTFTNEVTAEEMVENGDCIAAIFERNGDISVLRAPEGNIYSELTLSIVDSYKQIGSAAAVTAMSGKNINELLGIEIEVQDKPLGKRVPRAIDYYAVTMLVMMLMYCGMNGVDLFSKGLLGDTGSRLRLAPVTKPALVGGLLAASTVTSFLQGMVTFVFTGLAYGVYWGDRIPLVLLTLFAVVLFSQSTCILLLLLLRSPGAVQGATQALFWMMTFVSKGYAKITFGEADKIFQYAPNAMAHTVIFGAVYGGNESKMMFDLALLFGISAVMFVLAFLFGRRRLA